jgi:hypothetical protein
VTVPATPPTAGRASPPSAAFSSEDVLGLGIVVACIVVLELVGGIAIALAGGPVVLGLGLVLDAGARALGTAATVRAGAEWGTGWPWVCGLVGSPAVVRFAFNADGTFANVELAPLAGPLAVTAIIVLVIGLAGLPVGV